MPSPIFLPLLSCPSVHSSHTDMSFQVCTVGNDCLAQDDQPVGHMPSATLRYSARSHICKIVYSVYVKCFGKLQE